MGETRAAATINRVVQDCPTNGNLTYFLLFLVSIAYHENMVLSISDTLFFN